MDVALLHVLLPRLDAVVADEVAVDRGVIRVRAHTRPETGWRCPDCGTLSARAHSCYERHLADTAIGGRPVVIDLSAGRLFCDNLACCVLVSRTTLITVIMRLPDLVSRLEVDGLLG